MIIKNKLINKYKYFINCKILQKYEGNKRVVKYVLQFSH